MAVAISAVAAANNTSVTDLEAPQGRVLENVFPLPADLEPGDELLITDMARFGPAEAISDYSVKGKWWRREYTVEGVAKPRSLLSVELQDLDDPESCLAPALHLPLDLEGWYEIWVLTYRHHENGGVDVRLSGEPYFLHADPLQVNPESPDTRYGALVELRYRAADLTGQDLVFQQPYGTYESQSKLANASLAGVRLIKLSDAEVADIQAERQATPPVTVGYDNDGFSYFHRWAVHDKACIARLLEPLRDTSATFLNYELGGLGGLFIPTPFAGMYQMTGHTRHGDYRANAFYRWCFENDVDILQVLTDRAHEVDLKLYASLMLQRCFSPDDVMREHPEWKVKRGPGTWDYAIPEVQDYQVKKLAWIMENHEIDGFIVDFTRYGHHFNQDEPDKFGHMNAFLRKVRAATDAVNAKKERNVALCASFGDRSWHLTHWGTGKLEDQGLDVQTWLDEGLFDVIMPEGPTAIDFVAMAQGTATEVWPRFVKGVDIETHTKLDGQDGPKDIERGVHWACEHGAPGIFFFNYEPWTTLARVGYPDELAKRVETPEVYGLQEGPDVVFSTWCPSLPEVAAQRETFAPLTVPAHDDGKVDAEVVIRVINTFPETVEARVLWEEASGWRTTAKKSSQGGSLTIRGTGHQILSLAPQASEGATFRLTGRGAAPAVNVEFTAEGNLLVVHRIPVRAVPETGAPVTQEAALNVQIDERTRFAFSRDAETLYLTVCVEEIGPKAAGDDRTTRDANENYKPDSIELYIDPAAREESFMHFVLTPAGGQTDALWRYEPFQGHHARNTKWDGEWSAESLIEKDVWTATFSIPFTTLGRVPQADHVWRANVVVNRGTATDGDGSVSWAAQAGSPRDPARFGRLVFH